MDPSKLVTGEVVAIEELGGPIGLKVGRGVGLEDGPTVGGSVDR